MNANSGSLGIKSGGTSYLQTNERETYNDGRGVMDQRRKGTNIDFPLQLDATIDVESALEGYVPVNLRLERRETAAGDYVIALRESELGTGTRKAGQAIRTEVMNMLHEGATRVVIDCADVRMSSSFVDEVFGMLVVTLGFGHYSQQVGVKSLDAFTASLMHDIVGRRMAPKGW